MTIGCDLGNRIVGIMGGDAIMAEFEKYAKPMPQMIPLLELQDIRREIDNIDEVALFKETILEILDKHISAYEDTL